MKTALDKGESESHNDEDVVGSSARKEKTGSGTEPFFVTNSLNLPPEQDAGVDEREKTIISQRPVAAPEEFYKSMPLADLAAMLEGKRLDHFEVEQMIGGGGMGAVFRGRDERLDRTVAIKVIPGSKRDPETLRRFRLEAQAAARLDHPNIARVYYVGEVEQWNYIVFEFIDGVNIRDLVALEGPLSVDDAVFYSRQIAEALHHAHERGVVHRDIKPSNILVTASGVAKVVDMGLARSTSMDKSTADATASGVTLGTFDYISPEQARDPRDADVRSDLYSLGCSLFFMLTGHPPFPEGTALQKLLNHGSQPPPDPRGWRDDLSDQLYEIVMKLMAKQPGNRYQKPAELINDLMLLAKVEALPRSQSPGTMLMTPSVAQRSLLETNLPWMVAFAFLLGSTLWLQAVSGNNTFTETQLPDISGSPANPTGQAPNTVDLPPTETPIRSLLNGGTSMVSPPNSNASVNEEPTNTTNLPDPNGNDSRVPAGPSRDLLSGNFSLQLKPKTDQAIRPQGIEKESPSDLPIVVSEFRPADVEANRWESTIERALQRLEADNALLEIELRGRLIIANPLRLVGRDLVIRGVAETSPKIEFAPGLFNELDDWSGAIQLRNASLGLYGVAIYAAPTGIVRQRKIGILDLAEESDLILNGCSLTIAGLSESAKSMFAILADEKSVDSPNSIDQPDSMGGATITTLDTVIRGQASCLGLRIDPGVYRRVGVGITNCLLALDGVALDISRANDSQDPVARQVRLVCRQSTFVTQAGFALLDFSGPSIPLLSLIRTSDNCLFASYGNGAHFVIQGPITQSIFGNMRWLVLKGNDNAYDDGLTAIAAGWDRNGDVTTTFGFNEASQEMWFDERGIERRIAWISKPARTVNLSQAKLADFRIQQDGFFSAGAEDSEGFPALE